MCTVTRAKCGKGVQSGSGDGTAIFMSQRRKLISAAKRRTRIVNWHRIGGLARFGWCSWASLHAAGGKLGCAKPSCAVSMITRTYATAKHLD